MFIVNWQPISAQSRYIKAYVNINPLIKVLPQIIHFGNLCARRYGFTKVLILLECFRDFFAGSDSKTK